MSDILNDVIDVINKNGVSVEIENVFCEHEEEGAKRLVKRIVNLDFSEHDKVFEDKITKLEKENKALNSYLIQREQDSTDMIMKLKQEKSDKNDKIAELEKEVVNYKQAFEDKCKDYDFTSELLNKFGAENESLKQRIAELESKETKTVSDIDTSSPLACAESLIEHMTHREKFMFMPERDVQTFSVEELKEIADYLIVYYRHHRDRDAEEPISF